MTVQWNKQQREVDSYNVFFSSFKGESSTSGLFDLNYRLVGSFMTVPDNREGIEVEPDMVLFNGETLLLTEIKSGTNINQRDIKQMEKCNQVSIEAAIEFLSDAEIESSGLDHNDLTNIEPIIVYWSGFIEECRDSPGCQGALSDLSEHCTILSQEKGGQLQIEESNITDTELEETLSDGLKLPTLPETNFYLTENVNREILAYSIAHDCVLPNLKRDSRIELAREDVIERYRHREIPLSKLDDALKFLEGIGGCSQVSDGVYRFEKARLSNLLSVTSQLEETRVLDYIGTEEEESQTSLEEFSDFGGAEFEESADE